MRQARSSWREPLACICASRLWSSFPGLSYGTCGLIFSRSKQPKSKYDQVSNQLFKNFKKRLRTVYFRVQRTRFVVTVVSTFRGITVDVTVPTLYFIHCMTSPNQTFNIRISKQRSQKIRKNLTTQGEDSVCTLHSLRLGHLKLVYLRMISFKLLERTVLA